MRRPIGAWILWLAALAPSGAAEAQTRPAQPAPSAPVAADPSVTTAAFGDWILRCEAAPAGKAARLCEADQTIQVHGQAAPIAQIAFGRPQGAQAFNLIVIVPVDVIFPSVVTLGVGDKDPAPAELAWRRCLPLGCVAELAVPAETMTRWRAESGQGRITFKDSGGRAIVVPISFRGLAQALDALMKP